MTTEERLARLEAHLGLTENTAPTKETEPLRDWVVPLAHETLAREQVAKRCIAAAVKRGYKKDKNRYWGEYSNGKTFYLATGRMEGSGFYNHVCQGSGSLTTLESFEAYCGVEKPAKVYNAGFNFEYGIHSLNLPDGTGVMFSNRRWVKSTNDYKPQPHTLTPVERHTVGRFYRLVDGDPNQFEGYALCVGNNDFVQAQLTNGIVTVEYWGKGFVSMDEVTSTYLWLGK